MFFRTSVHKALTLFLAVCLAACCLTVPVCAESEDPASGEPDAMPGEVSNEESDRAFDEAMNDQGAIMAFYIVPSLAGSCTTLMAYAYGAAPEASAEASGNAAVQLMDEFILRTEWYFGGGAGTGETFDPEALAAFESAAADWKSRRAGFIAAYSDPSSAFAAGTALDDEKAIKPAADAFEQMPQDARVDYLESSQAVFYAAWPLLQKSLLAKTGIPELAEMDLSELGGIVQEGFDLISRIKTRVSVGFDQERYEGRIRVERVSNRLNALNEFVRVACRALELDNP